jgi:RNA polymerase sigma-70 factor (ECF subfamily)
MSICDTDTHVEATPQGTPREGDPAVAAATGGDEPAFALLVHRYRRELQAHCYRLVGSFEEAEDVVQETFLRAWRNRANFEGRSTFRTWLYRIATNASLDALRRGPRRAVRSPGAAAAGDAGDAGGAIDPAARPYAQVPRVQPRPTTHVDEAAPSEAEPDAAVAAKETIELAFLAAVQHLSPKQRTVLVLRDGLGWPAGDTAALLATSVAAANSALQRARATLVTHRPGHPLDWAPASGATAEERALLRHLVDAHERGDAAAVAALLPSGSRR